MLRRDEFPDSILVGTPLRCPVECIKIGLDGQDGLGDRKAACQLEGTGRKAKRLERRCYDHPLDSDPDNHAP